MLSVLKLDTLDGRETYQTLLSSSAMSAPYFLPDYFAVFCEGFENLICFFYEAVDSKSVVLMPGYLKPIVIGPEATGYFDFITPYGYSGPIFSKNVVQTAIVEFWASVDQWYKNNNVVSEFVRFNLSGNQVHYSGITFPTMLNVKGKIIDEASQWASFDAKVRKNVNRAKRENLYVGIYFKTIGDDKIAEFYRIYIQTMKRTQAKENFFYTLSNFELFIKNNQEYVAICTVYFEDCAISSELLMVANDSIYSFLGGTDEQYFDKRPNDFLKVEALNWARNEGKKNYVLGGGYGYEDGIFKYKRAFFPEDVVPYYTGRKIVNEALYANFIDKTSELRVSRGLEKLDSADSSFFPLYNKQN